MALIHQVHRRHWLRIPRRRHDWKVQLSTIEMIGEPIHGRVYHQFHADWIAEQAIGMGNTQAFVSAGELIINAVHPFLKGGIALRMDDERRRCDERGYVAFISPQGAAEDQ